MFGQSYDMKIYKSDGNVIEIWVPEIDSITFHETSTVNDIDGNSYQTVKIGDQLWIAENLKVIHYRNGDAIPNVTDDTEWGNLTTAAYCNFNNNDSNGIIYGHLYNWYTVNDSRGLAPQGWHVPSQAEWQTLVDYLCGINVGGKIKEAGTDHWTSPNSGATNESGFSALPGGVRNVNFYNLGQLAGFWSSTEFSSYNVWCWAAFHDWSGFDNSYLNKQMGFSVRCIRD